MGAGVGSRQSHGQARLVVWVLTEASGRFLVIRLSSHLPGNLRNRSGSQTHIVSFVRGAKFGGMNRPSVLPAPTWPAGNLCLLGCRFPSVANKRGGRGWGLPVPCGLADPLLSRTPAQGSLRAADLRRPDLSRS